MTRGRKPLAAEHKEATGAYRIHPERRNKDAPKADGDQPEMPLDFGPHESQKWGELCKDLKKNGVLSSDNREILIAYCTAYAGWMRCRELIRKTDVVIITKDKNGKSGIGRNPVSVELHKYREEMNRLLPELGLTPASRQKLTSLKLDDDKADDPFAGLMERMGRG